LQTGQILGIPRSSTGLPQLLEFVQGPLRLFDASKLLHELHSGVDLLVWRFPYCRLLTHLTLLWLEQPSLHKSANDRSGLHREIYLPRENQDRDPELQSGDVTGAESPIWFRAVGG
jgi:hypothetical protein